MRVSVSHIHTHTHNTPSLPLSLSPSPSHSDPQMDLEAMDLCVNAIASTLKAFFKLLPDPLIPNELLPELLEIPGGRNRRARVWSHHENA